MNNVSLTGRLTREPELRYGGQDNSTAITRFTLAVDDGKDTDYLQPLAALIAGGNWNNGANCGARAVNCNNYPWNVNTNIGARGACDLVRTLQAQSSTEYWQGLRKG